MNIRELLIRVGIDGGNTERELNNIDRATDKVKRGFASLGGILSTVFAAGSLRSLIQTADAMQNLQSQIGNSIGDMGKAGAMFDELKNHANETRTDLDAYVGSWAKMNQGIQRFGGSTEDTTKFVDTLSAAFTVNGTSAESANSALFQLSQTMQSGVVQGEEMNSFLDAQGTLANEVMTSIGGTVQGYKKMQAAGKVTAKMLMDAVNKQYPKYIDQLRKMPMTMGNAWTIMKNDVKAAIGDMNREGSFTAKIAAKIIKAWDAVTKGISDFVDKTGGLTAAADHIQNLVAPLLAVGAALMSFKALAFLTSPIGLVLSLAAAIGVLYDDYMTWKNGGDAFINWEEWEPAIKSAIEGIDWLVQKFKEITGAKDDAQAGIAAFGAMFATLFGVKMVGAVASVVKAIGGISGAAAGAMGQITALIAAGTAASSFWDNYIDQTKDANGKEKETTAGGVLVKDSAFGRGYDAVSDFLTGGSGGTGAAAAPTGLPSPYALPPQTLPGVTSGATNTVNNSPVYNVTINAPQGSDPKAIGAEVARQTSGQTPRDTMAESLTKNAGAR
ncbi:tape measure protein [Leclercia adecarboxylata]|uniref:tape measure protein n=1 Tax=Leclercia adecarboxylata TaxID=83655 RepID=UPI00370A9194